MPFFRLDGSDYGASGAHKQINGVLKARSQCWLTLIAKRCSIAFVDRKQNKQKEQEEK